MKRKPKTKKDILNEVKDLYEYTKSINLDNTTSDVMDNTKTSIWERLGEIRARLQIILVTDDD